MNRRLRERVEDWTLDAAEQDHAERERLGLGHLHGVGAAENGRAFRRGEPRPGRPRVKQRVLDLDSALGAPRRVDENRRRQLGPPQTCERQTASWTLRSFQKHRAFQKHGAQAGSGGRTHARSPLDRNPAILGPKTRTSAGRGAAAGGSRSSRGRRGCASAGSEPQRQAQPGCLPRKPSGRAVSRLADVAEAFHVIDELRVGDRLRPERHAILQEGLQRSFESLGLAWSASARCRASPLDRARGRRVRADPW